MLDNWKFFLKILRTFQNSIVVDTIRDAREYSKRLRAQFSIQCSNVLQKKIYSESQRIYIHHQNIDPQRL